KLSDDPNERDNPRELQDSHVALLAEVFKSGGKRDLQSPIRIMVSRSLIKDDLAKQMSEVNVHEPSTMIPRLVLERDTAQEEDTLEKEIWLQSDGKFLLGTDDLNERIAKLRALREERARATLVNGNHRIAAMRAACVPLYQEQRDILRGQREGEPVDELLERVGRMEQQLRQASYVVEVFDGKYLFIPSSLIRHAQNGAPAHVVAWLSENEEDRPNLAPRSGEKLWQLTRHQEGWATRMVDHGETVDRTEALDRLYSVKDIAGKSGNLTEQELQWAAAIDVRPGQQNEKSKPGVLSHKACRDLMGHPVLNDMSFLERVKDDRVPVEGREEAVKHWEALHADEQRVPVPLRLFEGEGSDAFESIFQDELAEAGLDDPDRADVASTSLGHDYESDAFVRAARNAYCRFAGWIEEKGTHHARLVAASMRVYAWLPRWAVGCGDNRFFPAAILPTQRRLSSIESKVTGAHDSTGVCMRKILFTAARVFDGPVVLGLDLRLAGSVELETDCAVVRADPGGAQGGATLLGRAAIGSYLPSFLPLLCSPQALRIIESPALIEAMRAAEAYDEQLSNLRQKCGASRSGPASAPIFAAIVERNEESFGKLSVVQAKSSAARTALRGAIWEGKGDVKSVLAAHPILTRLTPKEAWARFDFRAWALGWRDEAPKRLYTVQGGLGWFYLSEELRIELAHRIFDESPAARELLRTAREVV
ncbi:hypothetical protein FRC06_009450, partial [Ceratobasidium sp. 370]